MQRYVKRAGDREQRMDVAPTYDEIPVKATEAMHSPRQARREAEQAGRRARRKAARIMAAGVGVRAYARQHAAELERRATNDYLESLAQAGPDEVAA
ncbi:hypothetical protein [Agromyces sp. NPDC058104]|uniref:hypothetical protein n=1 Tax=Agromyces sp. NPDC058104 TaxID=3346342 RepID=UPI0036DD0700